MREFVKDVCISIKDDIVLLTLLPVYIGICAGDSLAHLDDGTWVDREKRAMDIMWKVYGKLISRKTWEEQERDWSRYF